MFSIFRKLFGFFSPLRVDQLMTTYKLEDLQREHPSVEFGVEPVEIVDQKMLEEFLSLKRRGASLWRPKPTKSDEITVTAEGGEDGRSD